MLAPGPPRAPNPDPSGSERHFKRTVWLRPVCLGKRNPVPHRSPVAVLLNIAAHAIHDGADTRKLISLRVSIEGFELVRPRANDFTEITDAVGQPVLRIPPAETAED